METVFALLAVIGAPVLMIAGLVKPSIFGGGRKRAVAVALGVATASFVGFGFVHDPPEKAAGSDVVASERTSPVSPQTPSVPPSTTTTAQKLPTAASTSARNAPALPDQQRQAPSGSVPMPDDQVRFLALVEDFQRRFDGASNDMARGALRPERAAALCSTLKSPTVRDWTGRISNLSSTNDGRGVLEVRLARQASLETTNNSLSDESYGMRTLIAVGSPLHQRVLSMRVGQVVAVSGSFLHDRDDCVKELSLTVRGAMRDPSFLFRFSDVRPME